MCTKTVRLVVGSMACEASNRKCWLCDNEVGGLDDTATRFEELHCNMSREDIWLLNR